MKTSLFSLELSRSLHPHTQANNANCVDGLVGYIGQYKSKIDMGTFMKLAWRFWQENGRESELTEMQGFCNYMLGILEINDLEPEDFALESKKWNGKK